MLKYFIEVKDIMIYFIKVLYHLDAIDDGYLINLNKPPII